MLDWAKLIAKLTNDVGQNCLMKCLISCIKTGIDIYAIFVFI